MNLMTHLWHEETQKCINQKKATAEKCVSQLLQLVFYLFAFFSKCGACIAKVMAMFSSLMFSDVRLKCQSMLLSKIC